jgi:hypothetical protein
MAGTRRFKGTHGIYIITAACDLLSEDINGRIVALTTHFRNINRMYKTRRAFLFTSL